jgi:hypothetical protein
MEKSFKKLNTEELGFTYEIVSEVTDKFGNIIKTISTSDGKTLDMIDSVSLNTKYFKLSTDDWDFGMSNNDKLLVSEVGKFINYKIEKSGSSTIGGATNIKEFTMTPTRENRAQYRQFIIDSNKNQIKKPETVKDLPDYSDFSGYTHFFVYRDPIKRFLSMANFCNNVQSVGQTLNQKFNSKREIIDNYLLLCSITETNENPKSGECHFLSQAKHLLNVDKVDNMVMIEDLSDFIKTKLGDKISSSELHKNKTREKSDLHLEVSDLTQDDIDKIKLIFVDDYTLYETYKDIIWTK